MLVSSSFSESFIVEVGLKGSGGREGDGRGWRGARGGRQEGQEVYGGREPEGQGWASERCPLPEKQ